MRRALVRSVGGGGRRRRSVTASIASRLWLPGMLIAGRASVGAHMNGCLIPVHRGHPACRAGGALVGSSATPTPAACSRTSRCVSPRALLLHCMHLTAPPRRVLLLTCAAAWDIKWQRHGRVLSADARQGGAHPAAWPDWQLQGFIMARATVQHPYQHAATSSPSVCARSKCARALDEGSVASHASQLRTPQIV